MITKEQAVKLGRGRATIYHATMRNRDGAAFRARANGACKIWKRDPARFSLPIKHGLRDCGYVTNDNASEWFTFDPTELNLPGAPASVLHDAAIDAGLIPG